MHPRNASHPTLCPCFVSLGSFRGRLMVVDEARTDARTGSIHEWANL